MLLYKKLLLVTFGTTLVSVLPHCFMIRHVSHSIFRTLSALCSLLSTDVCVASCVGRSETEW